MARRVLSAAALATAAAIAAAAPLGASALAQDAGPATEAPAGQVVPDDKLESYVTAAMEVSAIVEAMRPDMEAAQASGETAEIDQVRTELSERLTAAVQSVEGITVEEYQRITRAARSDEALLDRIRAIAQERMEG